MTKKKQPEIKPLPNTEVILSELVQSHKSTIIKILFQTAKPPSACNCGCCCCCCSNSAPSSPGEASPCSIDEFSVQQELRLDPNSFSVPGGPAIIGTRAVIAWSVTAPIGSNVTVQVRTRGLDGNPGGTFDDWTDTIFVNQSLIDQIQFNFNDFLGTKVEFRIVVLDSDGNILCVGAPDS